MADPTTVWELVNSQFHEANEYADEAWGLAVPFINDLKAAITISDIDEAAVDFTFDGVPEEAVSVVDVPTQTILPIETGETYPEYSGSVYDDKITGIATKINGVVIPTELGVTAEPIVPPVKPTVTDPTDPGDPPAPSDVVVPDAPAITYPVEPAINTTYLMPDRPNISFPSFTAVQPIDNTLVPTNTFNYHEEAYQSDLLDALKAKLAADLAAGGTGLGADAEAAIWARAADRQAELDEKLYDETMNFFSSRGWSIPPGALAGRLAEAHNESRRSSEKLNNDILVQQSQLAYQNVKDTITAITALEQVLIQHSDIVANRALDAAKYTVEAAISIFNAHVAKLNIAWEGYKAAASVYEVMTRTQSLLVEIYTAELNAVKLESDIELSKLEVYKSQLQAISLQIEVYKGELQGAATKAEVEKLKLAMFQTRVEIFTAKINANTAKYNQYQAEWAGETTKVQLYSEQVKAFVAEVSAGTSTLDAYSKQLAAYSALEESEVRAFSAEIESYKAFIVAKSAYLDSQVKIYAADAGMYEADIRRAVAVAESNIKVNEANLKTNQGRLELELKQAEINIQNANTENQLRIEAAKAGAAVTAQMTAGALASINTSAGMTSSSAANYDQTKDVHSYSHIYSSQDCGCS